MVKVLRPSFYYQIKSVDSLPDTQTSPVPPAALQLDLILTDSKTSAGLCLSPFLLH
jgi:hypothetical protein